MWQLNARSYDKELRSTFGDDYLVVQTLSILPRYSIHLEKFSNKGSNKFKIYRYEPDPSTPQHVVRKKLLCEFDEMKEFVAMARLIVASETN